MSRRISLSATAGASVKATAMTDLGAELHEGLVEVAGVCGIDEACGPTPESGGRRSGIVHQARKHPPHIPIDRRYGNSEGDRCHGSGGIGTHPRERLESLRIARDPPLESTRYLANGAVQVPGPRVVSEALPEPEHLLFPRFGDLLSVWEPLQPLMKVWGDGFRAGLLQHHLRDEDSVRIPIVSPREISVCRGKEGQEGSTNAVTLFTGRAVMCHDGPR